MKMKIKTFIALLSAILILFGAQFSGFSQEADTITSCRPGFYAGFSLGAAQSHLVNDGISAVSNQISNPMNALSGSAEFGYYFSKYFGLSTGIGLSSCNSEVTLNTYQSNFNAVDSESEAYQRQVTGTGIREQEKITFLTVPVCLNFRIPLNKTVGLFMQTGVAIAVPLVKNYISSGIFSYKGYYPAYNVLLENLPAYGFPANVNSVTKGRLELKPVNVNAVVNAGFDFFVQKKIQFALAVSYNQSLSTISAYTSPDKFQLSSDAGQINSLIGASTKSTAQSIGMNLTLRYFF
ncbi:MAG: outer membrane beta-barrel protein [Mariniphaga sp.]